MSSKCCQNTGWPVAELCASIPLMWTHWKASAALLKRCSHSASIVNTAHGTEINSCLQIARREIRLKGNNIILESKMPVWTKSSSRLQRNYFVNALFGGLNHWRQSFLSVFFFFCYLEQKQPTNKLFRASQSWAEESHGSAEKQLCHSFQFCCCTLQKAQTISW